jgi:heterodisulfide reductase subunit D
MKAPSNPLSSGALTQCSTPALGVACVEVCPVTAPGGVKGEPPAVIDGVIDILRRGEGSDAARKWATACVSSGECIKACDYGVNPRFLLSMARVTMAQHENSVTDRRRHGIENFRQVARDVTHISRLQLDEVLLARLGQKSAVAVTEPELRPDFVFYTGCNVLKTPHIALLEWSKERTVCPLGYDGAHLSAAVFGGAER